MDGRRSVMALLSVCLVASTVFAASYADGHLKVDLSPRDLLVATGDNLTVVCSLSHTGRGLSANDLYFTLNNNSLLDAGVVVEVLTDREAAMMMATNVQRNMSGVVECRHRSEDVAPDTMRVIVADRPKKPRIRECIVRNWENMSCFWDGQEENGIETNISVCYSIDHVFNHRNCFLCPNPDFAGKRSCSWFKSNKSDRFLDRTHWILIVATNRLGRDYDLRGFNPNEDPIVRPDGVRNVSCVANGSQSCVVNWNSSSVDRSLNYRIRFKSRWDNEERIVKTEETAVTLVGLVPSTEYRFVVDCIPLVGGFWSSPELCDCRTETDVPAMNPPVTFGAHRVLKADDKYGRHGQRLIQLHWQRIPRRWANGEILAIRLRIRKRSDFFSEQHLDLTIPWDESFLKASMNPMSSAATGDVLMLSGSNTNATVALDVDSTFVLTVEARTSAGFNESLKPTSIVIPRKNETPPFPERFVVATDFANRYYTFINTSTSPNASKYTIYWCRTTRNRPDICSSPYNWTRISASQLDHELHLPDHPCSSVRFHVSVESMLPSGEIISSGMMAVDSIYSRHGVVRMPRNVRLSETAIDSQSLTIRWDVDRNYCKNHSVYVSHYIVRYCSTTCRDLRVEGGLVDVARIGGLLPGTVYAIQMKSVSFGQESHFTESIVGTTLFPLQESQKDEIIAAVSVTTGGIVLVCVLLICFQLKRIKSRSSIQIVVPKKYSLPEVKIENDGYWIHALPIDNYDPYFHSHIASQNFRNTRVISLITYPTWTSTSPYDEPPVYFH